MSEAETSELDSVLSRRQAINDGEVKPVNRIRKMSIYHDNPDMSKKTIDEIKAKFEEFDLDKNGVMDENELTYLFEKLGAPQTRLKIRELIRAVDENGDGVLNLQEFISVFKKAASELLDDSSPLKQLALLTEIDVSLLGVKSATQFFEAQVKKQSEPGFMKEIEDEMERKKAAAEEKARRQQAMQELKAFHEGKANQA